MEIIEEFEQYLNETYSTEGEKNTIKSYISDIRQFLSFYNEMFGEKIITFNHVEVTEYKNYMKDKMGYKVRTINRKIASLSVYDDFLIETGRHKEKSVKKRDFYKIERPLITADMIPTDNIKKVRLIAMKENIRDYTMIVLFDEGGLRASELVNLELERNIDIPNRAIQVLGKGNKLRTVVMSDNMASALEEYKNERQKLLKDRANKYLFISNKTVNTGKPMLRNSLNNIINKYCDELRIDRFHPHTMRHDFATTSYIIGYSDVMLKKQLGDSSNAVDIYIHPGREDLLSLTNKR